MPRMPDASMAMVSDVPSRSCPGVNVTTGTGAVTVSVLVARSVAEFVPVGNTVSVYVPATSGGTLMVKRTLMSSESLRMVDAVRVCAEADVPNVTDTSAGLMTPAKFFTDISITALPVCSSPTLPGVTVSTTMAPARVYVKGMRPAVARLVVLSHDAAAKISTVTWPVAWRSAALARTRTLRTFVLSEFLKRVAPWNSPMLLPKKTQILLVVLAQSASYTPRLDTMKPISWRPVTVAVICWPG
mmetsp:Transcript_2872/g.10190  ORF Transcript_2872/g.10190 Transcript_2872/m.10190 type:complete len:243 (-) Transcript_2872:1445-2173(-)